MPGPAFFLLSSPKALFSREKRENCVDSRCQPVYNCDLGLIGTESPVAGFPGNRNNLPGEY